MANLILIKHASPQVEPAVPSERWKLSDSGREAAGRLADRLAGRGIARIASSAETKARETADVIATKLNIPVETDAALGEHDRSNVPHLPTREFISMVEVFFRRPRQLVLGNETADDALDRISDAVERLADTDETLAIVTHGTVLALLLEDRLDVDGFQTWRSMGLPSFVVVDEDWNVVERVDRV